MSESGVERTDEQALAAEMVAEAFLADGVVYVKAKRAVAVLVAAGWSPPKPAEDQDVAVAKALREAADGIVQDEFCALPNPASPDIAFGWQGGRLTAAQFVRRLAVGIGGPPKPAEDQDESITEHVWHLRGLGDPPSQTDTAAAQRDALEAQLTALAAFPVAPCGDGRCYCGGCVL